jgi:hypothetical protein
MRQRTCLVSKLFAEAKKAINDMLMLILIPFLTLVSYIFVYLYLSFSILISMCYLMNQMNWFQNFKIFFKPIFRKKIATIHYISF